MHKVRKTFLARQYGDVPAIGIKLDAIRGEGLFEVGISLDADNGIYYLDKSELRNFYDQNQSRCIWKNPKGIKVAIFPLYIFQRKENPQKSLF